MDLGLERQMVEGINKGLALWRLGGWVDRRIRMAGWPATHTLWCPHRPHLLQTTVHAVTEVSGGGSYPW